MLCILEIAGASVQMRWAWDHFLQPSSRLWVCVLYVTIFFRFRRKQKKPFKRSGVRCHQIFHCTMENRCLSFSFTHVFVSQQNLVILFFLKDLATHKPNLNQENPSTPTPWCPPNEARFPCCFGGGQRWDAKALGASAGRPWSTTTTLRGLGLGPSRWLVGSESSREEMGATPKLVGEFPHWLKNLGFMQPIVLRSWERKNLQAWGKLLLKMII